jgi:hypothetical protein
LDQEVIAKIVGDLYLNYHLLLKQYEKKELDLQAALAECQQLKELLGNGSSILG